MSKIIIVGNGFDLAHRLKTSYKDFADSYRDNPILIKFQELFNNAMDDSCKKTTWFSFEESMHIIADSIFQKNFCDDLDQDKIDSIEFEQEECNKLFSNLSNLLFEYLNTEYESKKGKIEILKNIKNEIGKNDYVISFNYTDTVKLYSQNIRFIHGSINEDNHIILGYPNNEVSDLSSYQYKNYWKEKMKERLNFIRFLKLNDIKSMKGVLEEFAVHLDSLFSGKGGYEDLNYTSEEIKQYAKLNDYKVSEDALKFDYSDIKEVIIMGHGLESDLDCLETIFKKIAHLDKVKLYTYNGEEDYELHRKIDVLQKISNFEKN